MKKILLLVFILLPVICFPANFKFNRKLLSVQTRFFEIIYPQESEKSARYLCSFADDLFMQVCETLHYTNTERIVVTITPDTDMLNGYCSTVPYTHIVLFDTPMTAEWTSFSEPFKSLFLHEMVHAVSLNIKTPFEDAINQVSSVMQIQSILQPMSMIEGITVSFESLDGFGRANDPMILEQLKQDIIENRFKSYLQISGPYTDYPYGNLYYHYGGIFCRYLQQNYGMEKFAKLWNLTASGTDYPDKDNENGLYGRIFQAVYKIPLQKLWADFKNSITVLNVTDNTNFVSLNRMSIPVLALWKNKIIIADDYSKKVIVYDPKNGKFETLFETDGLVEYLNVSQDGKTLLVSRYAIHTEGLFQYYVQFYDLEKKQFLDKKLEGIRQASYMGEDILAVRPDTHRTEIVKIDRGKTEVLASGSENLILENPVFLDSNRIVLLADDKGIRKIAILNLSTGNMQAVYPDGITNGYPRRMTVSEGKIYFSYNSDQTFYKLGVYTGTNFVLQTNNYSGGVFGPVPAGETLYYTAKMSDWDRFMQYPEKTSELTGIKKALITEPIDYKNKIDAGNFLLPPQKNYNALKYFNPFKLWAPYPTFIMSGSKIEVDSMNIYSYMSDPMDENIALLQLGHNWVKPMANISLNWIYSGGFPFTGGFSASDTVQARGISNQYFRQTSFSFNLEKYFRLIPIERMFFAGGEMGWIGVANDDGTHLPYYWKYGTGSLNLGVNAGYSGLTTTSRFAKYRGISWTCYYDYSVNYSLWKTETATTFAWESIPVLFNFYGAYAPVPVLTLNGWTPYFGNDHYPSYTEFQNRISFSDYYTFWNAQYTIWDTELQNGLWWLFFNRLYFTGGYRGSFTAGNIYQSVYSGVNLTSTLIPIGVTSKAVVSLGLDIYYRVNYNDFGWIIRYKLPI